MFPGVETLVTHLATEETSDVNAGYARSLLQFLVQHLHLPLQQSGSRLNFAGFFLIMNV